MITEDYVSLDTAKLLREKGFDEKCSHYWQDEISEYSITKEIHKWTDSALANTEISSSKRFSAPTIQMVMKWLREVHNLHIVVFHYDNSAFPYIWYIFAHNGDKPHKADSYEEACEEGIKYCLENLI